MTPPGDTFYLRWLRMKSKCRSRQMPYGAEAAALAVAVSGVGREPSWHDTFRSPSREQRARPCAPVAGIFPAPIGSFKKTSHFALKAMCSNDALRSFHGVHTPNVMIL